MKFRIKRRSHFSWIKNNHPNWKPVLNSPFQLYYHNPKRWKKWNISFECSKHYIAGNTESTQALHVLTISWSWNTSHRCSGPNKVHFGCHRGSRSLVHRDHRKRHRGFLSWQSLSPIAMSPRSLQSVPVGSSGWFNADIVGGWITPCMRLSTYWATAAIST